jgi:hypothetical protein
MQGRLLVRNSRLLASATVLLITLVVCWTAEEGDETRLHEPSGISTRDFSRRLEPQRRPTLSPPLFFTTYTASDIEISDAGLFLDC